MDKNPKFELFQRESRIKFIRNELENNEFVWMRSLHKKMQIPVSSISNYLKTYFRENIEIEEKKQGCRKLIILKNKKILEKEKECYKKADAIRYLQKCRKDGYSYSELHNLLRENFNIFLDIAQIVEYTKHISLNDEGLKRIEEKISKDRAKAARLSVKKQVESGRTNWHENLKNYDPSKSIKKQTK